MCGRSAGEQAVFYNCVMDRNSFDTLLLATAAALARGEGPRADDDVCGELRARPNPKTGMTGAESFALTLAELKDLVTLYNSDNFDNIEETMQVAGQVPYAKDGVAGRWIWEAGALPTVRRE